MEWICAMDQKHVLTPDIPLKALQWYTKTISVQVLDKNKFNQRYVEGIQSSKFSGHINVIFLSLVPICNDNIKNEGETGVDCGGPCKACPTCDDGIQNQGETDIDCGGPCKACPTCCDGIKNQGEIKVDCGGPCPACPTCDDNIQNQNETGVDCGGQCDTMCPFCNNDTNNWTCPACPTCWTCPACPTCDDGIQNQEETSIDCGGPCTACEGMRKTYQW